MNSVYDLAPTASSAVRAMVHGLENNSARTDFQVRMNTFGVRHKVTCYGCAATCAMQELTGISLTPYAEAPTTGEAMDTYDRANIFEVEHNTFSRFEDTIDRLRQGNTNPLLRFYNVYADGVEYDRFESKVKLSPLETNDWHEGLEPYKELAEELEAYEKAYIGGTQ